MMGFRPGCPMVEPSELHKQDDSVALFWGLLVFFPASLKPSTCLLPFREPAKHSVLQFKKRKFSYSVYLLQFPKLFSVHSQVLLAHICSGNTSRGQSTSMGMQLLKRKQTGSRKGELLTSCAFQLTQSNYYSSLSHMHIVSNMLLSKHIILVLTYSSTT